jgi:glycosyltransferase involved in cell wall biosynthesis
MEIGGSQLNAIEIGAAVRDLGHEVSVISEPGALLGRVEELGLPHIPLPDRRRRPSLVVAQHIRRLIRTHSLDIVHGYEWPPALEAVAATFGLVNTAPVCTVMSMAVAPFLPGSLPLVVGTEAIRQQTQALRSGPVQLLEPPVDVVANAPGIATDAFRARFGLERTLPGTGEPIIDIGVVCRLVPELKLEGVLAAVEAVGSLAAHRPVRLVVVGDGTVRDEVQRRAAEVNARVGRAAVVLTGELSDPRPAYAAFDIALGMGGSALRALAFGRPLVVQGEGAFWQLLTPESVDTFLHQGWYGMGDRVGGAERLTGILLPLLDDAATRDSLGSYGRRLAVERFSLQAAARVQESVYRQALGDRGPVRPGALVESGRSLGGLVAHQARRRYQRLRGTVARDDFNAANLAQAAMGPESASAGN